MEIKARAEARGLLVRVGRKTRWGNSEEMVDQKNDAEQERVIAYYRDWIQTQPHLLNQLDTLQGQALSC